MKRIVLLFSVLLSFVGVTQMKADTLEENFNDLTVSGTSLCLSNGWFIQGATLGAQGSSSSNWGSYSYELVSRDENGTSGKSLVAAYGSQSGYVIIPEDVTGTISFRVAGVKTSNGSYSIYAVSESEGTYTVGEELTNGTVAKKSESRASFGTWTTVTYVYSAHSMIAIKFDKAAIDNFSAEKYEVVDGPALTVKDGSTKLTSPYAYDFGLATAGTTHVFTLSNPGTENLGVSVSETGDFGATLSATTIAAGGEVTLTVTMPSTTGSSAVTITPDAEGIAPFVINVSGTVQDPNKMFVDFADGQMPDGWENVMIGSYGSGWQVNEGYASHSNSASSYYLAALTSPLLTFAEGEKLFFDVARYGSSTYNTATVKVQTSTDGETWTDVYTTPDEELVYGEWKTQSVTMEAGNYYVRFYGGYAHITNIYGGELPLEPNFKFSAADYGFGMISEAKTSGVYTIQNTGRAQLTGVSVTSSNDNFVVSTVPATIAANGEATFTVTMKTDVKGAQNGTITVAADGFDAVAFNVSGYVTDDSKLLVTFADNEAPARWKNTGWTFADGVATGAYTSETSSRNSEIVTPAIEVAAGETMAIEAKGTSSYAELYVYTSTDNGTTWTQVGDFNSEVRASTAAYTVLVLSGIDAGSYKLKFEGYGVSVRTINGFAYDQNAPELAVSPAEDFAAGKVTESVTKTYTVENAGTGTLVVDIASDSEDFSVEPAQLTITDEAKTFTVTFNYAEGNYGDKAATITLTPTYDEAAALTIQATATAKDANLWEEDFEDGMPAFWQNDGGWSVTTPTASGSNGTKMMTISSYGNPKTLVTPRLQAQTGAELTFYIGMQYDDEPLTIEYQKEGDDTWSVIEEGVDNYTASGDVTFTAPADGYYYLRFTGTYAMLDNFEGFRLALPDHITTITGSNIPTTGLKQDVAFNATVTVAEFRGVDEDVTAELYAGDAVIGTATATLAANGTATLTIVATPTVPGDDVEMYIKVTYAGGTLTTDKVSRSVAAPAVLVLDENAYSDPEAGTYDIVTLQRTFKQGWNTFVLPFSMDLSLLGEGAQAFRFTGFADNAFRFSRLNTTTLNPATPYVIYVPETIDTPITFTDVTVSSMYLTNIYDKHDGVVFQGTYSRIFPGGFDDLMAGLATDGHIRRAGNDSSIKGLRAYFDQDDSRTYVKAETVADDVDEADAKFFTFDAVTGISEVNTTRGADVYNLAGQRMQQAQRGINIVGGKKIVVK